MDNKKPIMKRLGAGFVWEMPGGELVPVVAGAALLGTFIDQRTLAAPAGAASSSYAHGIVGLTPDFVGVVFATTAASIASPGPLCVTYDATNVSIANPGNSASPVPTLTAIRFHTMIR